MRYGPLEMLIGGEQLLLDRGPIRLGDALAARVAELHRLCAFYLLHATDGKGPLDSVARFHLANGARLERLNWQADTSEVGIHRSCGLMAHYVYRLAQLEANHEAYARDGRIIASHEVRQLAKPARHVP